MQGTLRDSYDYNSNKLYLAEISVSDAWMGYHVAERKVTTNQWQRIRKVVNGRLSVGWVRRDVWIWWNTEMWLKYYKILPSWNLSRLDGYDNFALTKFINEYIYPETVDDIWNNISKDINNLIQDWNIH
jgi:hypothetical protein